VIVDSADLSTLVAEFGEVVLILEAVKSGHAGGVHGGRCTGRSQQTPARGATRVVERLSSD
jgi:hypothetical protein